MQITPDMAMRAMKVMNNPNEINNLLKGKDPESMVREQCKQQGIDVDEFMSQVKQFIK